MEYNPNDDSYDYNRAGELLFVLHKNNQKYLNDRISKYDLNLLQAICLITLYSNKNITQQELSGCLFLTKSGITKAIHDLEFNKYIRRMKSEKDGRRYSLILTYKGEKIVPKLIKIFEEWEESLGLDDLDDETAKVIKNLTYKSIELNS